MLPAILCANQLGVNTIGGSVSVTYRIKEFLRLAANYTYRFSYYTSESASGLREKGDRVPWEPAHLFNASATYLARRGLVGQLLGRRVFAFLRVGY